MNIDVRDVPIIYVGDFEFYKYIKRNFSLEPERYEDVDQVKQRYRLYCELIPGLYKWKEKAVIIKKNRKSDISLLLVELLHSKSITQGKPYIEDWLREGLPHYLSKLICEKQSIPYAPSAHDIYFRMWKEIHERHGIQVLKKILYVDEIRLTLEILKKIFTYDKDDILEISFQNVKEFL